MPMEIIRGRLSAKDYSNPALRLNPDTDVVEFTPDDGVTWTPAPSADPRHSDLYRKPVLETADPRCDAAANMVKWMKDFIDSMTSLLEAGAIAFTLINTAIELMSPVFPPDLFVLPITEACEILFSIGGGALLAAFDTEQYDLLQCAFFCNIEDDGSCTVEDFVNIQSQVTDTMNTTAAIVVNLLLSLQGEVGVSNAGVIGGQTGDCDDCSCAWYYRLDLTVSEWGFSAINYNTEWGDVGACTGLGSWTEGVGYQNSNDGSGWFQLGVRGLIPDWILAANPEQWAANFQAFTCGGYSYGRAGVGVETSGHATAQMSWDAEPNHSGGTGILDRGEGLTQIDVGACAGACNSMSMTYIEFWGHGTAPVEP